MAAMRFERPAALYSGLAAEYEEARPGYPDELYELVREECRLGPGARILEIGAGIGTATGEMLARWGAEITALEPNPELFARLEAAFSGEPRVRPACSRFEDFRGEGRYDCIVSATAFHWIDRKTRFRLCDALLAPGGSLALFWNNYSRDDDPVFDEIQAAYNLHYPLKTSRNDIRVIQAKSIQDRKNEIIKSGLFAIASAKEFLRVREYDAPTYVKLLKTIAKNASLDPAAMEVFYAAIAKVIARRGGTLRLPVLTDLVVARRISERS